VGTDDSTYSFSTSTGARLEIWRHNGLFCAQRQGADDPEVCLGVDLFEVIAELGGLDLDDKHQAAEAQRLSRRTQDDLARSDAAR
jgi:hypothetical protein